MICTARMNMLKLSKRGKNIAGYITENKVDIDT